MVSNDVKVVGEAITGEGELCDEIEAYYLVYIFHSGLVDPFLSNVPYNESTSEVGFNEQS